MRYYRTKYPIRADQLCQQIYNDISYTEELIRLNPHIMTQPIIPADVVLQLPKIHKKEDKGINLWS